MTIENNPLKQFFRRPAIYIKLPSGGKAYDLNTISMPENEELPVYPLTAIDEITLKTPDALYNGSAMIEVIKSCVPNIKDPWKLNAVDFDAVLIAMRTASEGNDQTISSTCPSCNEDSTFGINLVGLLTGLDYKVYGDELAMGDLIIKFKPLEYKHINEINIKQFETQKVISQISSMPDDSTEKTELMKKLLYNISNATMQALSLTIEYIKTPNALVNQQHYILDYLQNCDKTSYEVIKDHSMKLKELSETKPIKIQCVHCKHEFQQKINLNMSDFFGAGF